ncbi:MAG: hypothetical protein SCH71_06395 [Desulfobulbaceae bacterium]|nr:hypothetical protein [Desulfobulbaceae bacterium]
MIYSLPDFLASYWPYLLGAGVVCALLSYASRRFLGFIKKILILLAILFVLSAGYELITGSSIFILPGSVERKLSGDPDDIEEGHRYYKSYEERYGEKPPD